MSAGQSRSETPEPPWVKKFVVGLYCGAAYHDVAFVGHGGTVRLFDFDARMCALAGLFFPDENVVWQFDIRAERVEALVADAESVLPDPDRQWLHINAGLSCNDGSKANPRHDPPKLLEHVATFFFVVRRLQERFAKVAWFAVNVVYEPFVATMKALFPDSVHEVIDSGRFTAEQRKRAYFASPQFDLTKLAELDGGFTVEE